MSRRSISAGFSLVIAFAMALGILLSSAHVAESHNVYAVARGEAVRHAELTATIAEHGHAHDDGEPAEQAPGHVHGHNASDHMHETGDRLGLVALPLPGFSRSDAQYGCVSIASGHPDGLERPPRVVVTV